MSRALKKVAVGSLLVFSLGISPLVTSQESNKNKQTAALIEQADRGNIEAQFDLGVRYAKGQGVRQNYVKAREWFGQACDNGLQQGCDIYRDLNK